MHNTVKMEQIEYERANEIREIIKTVYDALKVKGYNPVNQLVGYIQSGDPTYITNYNNARSLIAKVENDEIIEELVKAYITKF
ncbi:MAG: IreB family regulatory phosphoprotein [Clostridia bacterium]|nr:IreB family regulatory phosphoprotein [Clostridia bacterium]